MRALASQDNDAHFDGMFDCTFSGVAVGTCDPRYGYTSGMLMFRETHWLRNK